MKKLLLFILDTDTFSLETMLGIESFLWGLWLLLPFDTFSASPVYSVMNQIAPEHVWGIGMIVLGIAQIMVLCTHNPKARYIFSTGALFVWLFTDVGFWLSGSPSAAPTVYLIPVIMAAWSVASNSVREKNRGN